MRKTTILAATGVGTLALGAALAASVTGASAGDTPRPTAASDTGGPATAGTPSPTADGPGRGADDRLASERGGSAGGHHRGRGADDHGTRGGRGTDDGAHRGRGSHHSGTHRGRGADDARGHAGTGQATGRPAVTAAEAGRIAAARVGGAAVSRVEAETEHGVAVWSVRLVKAGTRYDVDVARADGSVRRVRT